MSWVKGRHGVMRWDGEPFPEPDPLELHQQYGLPKCLLPHAVERQLRREQRREQAARRAS